jgi:monoamine oxidase
MSRASRSPIMSAFRRCIRMAADPRPDHARVPKPPVLQNLGKWELNRRDFVKGAMALGAGTFLSGCSSNGKHLLPKVAVVGAGIAGLNATRVLLKGGLDPVLFEAGSRAGGRIMTLPNIIASGIYTEAGGEFIDSSHADMLGLAQELGLTIQDTQTPEYTGLTEYAFQFGGKIRTESEVVTAIREASAVIQLDLGNLPENIGAGTTGLALELDRMSLEEYLQSRGISGWLRDLIVVAYVTEFGLDANQQSSLNFLTMVSMDTNTGRFRIYGESDERYRIAGGNQGVTDALAKYLEDKLRLDHRLEAIAEDGTGYQLSFQGPSGPINYHADAVILTLPFTLLRKVDIKVALPPEKQRAISELGYGTNAKLFLGFNNRPWKKAGFAGYFFTDGPMQSGWDHSFTQPSQNGGITIFNGGNAGLALGQGGVSTQAENFMDPLDSLFPGSRASRNGKFGAFHWPTNPLALGSYACYKPGQWTSIAGEEGKPVGNLYFAGEHCSIDFQGYMNGGAITGRVTAEAILQKWKVKKPVS